MASPGLTVDLYQSATATTALDSGVIDVSQFHQVAITAYNAGSGTRSLTVTFYRMDGTTALLAWSTAVAITSTQGVLIGTSVTGMATPVKVEALGFIPMKLKVQFAAGASSAGWFHIAGRTG